MAKKTDSKTASDEQRQASLLSRMMALQMQGTTTASFKRLSKDLDFMERTKTWRASWSSLYDQGYIESASGDNGTVGYTSEYRITKTGTDRFATPEFQEYQREMTQPANTEEEHQARIKKKLLNKHGIRIYDLLLQHGSLSRNELAALIGVNDRSHSFSYALKQIKHLNFVEADTTTGEGKGKKLRLTDASFLDPSNRPATVPVDSDELEKLTGENRKPKRKKKADEGKKSTTSDTASEEDTTGKPKTKKRKKAETMDIQQEESKTEQVKTEQVKTESAAVKEEEFPDDYESHCLLDSFKLETEE